MATHASERLLDVARERFGFASFRAKRKVTVLFDREGYRSLSLESVSERQLLQEVTEA